MKYRNTYHNIILGDNGEELTCRIFGVENLNKKNRNYRSPIDHNRHPVLGILQTKTKLYDPYERVWQNGNLEREWTKKFNNLIFYCISTNGKIIERIYIFLKKVIIERKSLKIVKNPMNTSGKLHITPWYEAYRVTDEEFLRKANEIWSRILEEAD